jgi:hypothetical protein
MVPTPMALVVIDLDATLAVKAAGRESGRGRPDDGHGAGPSQATAGRACYISQKCQRHIPKVSATPPKASMRSCRPRMPIGPRFPSPHSVASAECSSFIHTI